MPILDTLPNKDEVKEIFESNDYYLFFEKIRQHEERVKFICSWSSLIVCTYEYLLSNTLNFNPKNLVIDNYELMSEA